MSELVNKLKGLNDRDLKTFLVEAQILTDDLSIELIKKICEPERKEVK